MKFVDEPLMDRAHRHAVDFLRALPERHVAPRATHDELMAALNVPLGDDGEDAGSVIDALASQADRGTMGSASPRFFGFVIGGSLPVALATDWLTGVWDQNAGLHVAAPVPMVTEEIARRWLLELFDLPREASLGFVTGCQMAHFTCLAAARHAVLRRAGWNVEEDGLHGAPRVNLVVSAEAHVTVDVALRYLGFGTRSLLRVETDEQGRMRPDRLARLLDNVSGPTIVCAQAGNVNTGSFDPLREIAALAREHDAWLHIDGAFGLWARASRKHAGLADGIELGDSWATDAHKWLNVPYDCGISLVRDTSAHRASMTTAAAYLEQTTGTERDAVDWTPEFSRRARGLTVYAALRHLGRRGVEDLVDRLCARATQMAELLSRDPRVKILNDVQLNQVLVRIDDDDARTRETVSRAQKDGTCWMAGTTWHGVAAIRISVSNWATSEQDIERSAEAILRSMPASS